MISFAKFYIILKNGVRLPFAFRNGNERVAITEMESSVSTCGNRANDEEALETSFDEDCVAEMMYTGVDQR